MTRARRPPRYSLTAVPQVRGDIDGLAAFGVEVVDAARAIADDLAHGRVVGKRLAGRNVSGDLTGFSRVKVDLPGRRPQRFRLLYREVDNVTLEIVAVGVRDSTPSTAQRLRASGRDQPAGNPPASRPSILRERSRQLVPEPSRRCASWTR